MRIITIIASFMLSLALTNCVSYDLSRRIVQQGNLLTEEKLAKLHKGMSKEAVAILMGNSLSNPVFNDNRWDYAYTLRKGNSKLSVKKVSIYFSHGAVSSIVSNR